MIPIRVDRALVHIPERGNGRMGADGQPEGAETTGGHNGDARAVLEAEKETNSFIAEIRPASLNHDPTIPTDRVIDHVQRLIDTLERYQKKLKKEKVSLQEIRSIIKKMTAESESLSEVSRQLPVDGSLRSIVNQSLILSSAEIVKFNSGVYDRA